jgi:hypothetical protein
MGKIKTIIEINMGIDVIYKNLKERYNSERFKKASIDTLGYVPQVKLIEDEVNSRIVFAAKANDTLTNIKLGGWKWGYLLQEIGENRTEVTIFYQWKFLMVLFSMGTIKHQAANELTETVMALDSLEQTNV